jgi:hypothetical protein
MLDDYKTYKHNIYDWVKEVIDLPVFPFKKDVQIKDEKFIIIEFGTLSSIGYVKPNEYTKRDDGYLASSIATKYKQTVNIEFYGTDTDYDAIALKNSIYQSSTMQALNLISINNDEILNTSYAVAGDYEERYMLSFDMYFALSAEYSVESIDSIKVNGTVNTNE